MRDASDQINELLREVTRAADILSEMSGTSVEYADVFDALVDVLELQSQTELLGDGLNAGAIAKHLSNYNFKRLHPRLIGEVFLDHSILPEQVAQRLVEVTVKAHGQVWRIHQNDADPAWSKISNALKSSGFRSRNFLRTAAF